MQVSGFHTAFHSNHKVNGAMSGIFPFRLQADLNASNVSQLEETQQRKDLADQVNQALDYYEYVASVAVRSDNGSTDMNSQLGKVGLAKVSGWDKSFDVYAEFSPNSKLQYQPISKAQIRLPGESRNLFEMATDAAGLTTLSLVDPTTRATLKACLDGKGAATVQHD